jgi:hypothetical protein
LVVIALAGVVVGCAAIEPVQIVGPSGKTAYTMRCSGAGRTLEACYKKAGEVCPAGYSLVDRASSTVALPLATGGFVAAPQQTLTVECR